MEIDLTKDAWRVIVEVREKGSIGIFEEKEFFLLAHEEYCIPDILETIALMKYEPRAILSKEKLA